MAHPFAEALAALRMTRLTAEVPQVSWWEIARAVTLGIAATLFIICI